MVLLLIASLVVSVILAAITWSKRTVGRFINKHVAGTEQIPSPLPSPGTGYSETEMTSVLPKSPPEKSVRKNGNI
jgi:hypothetical protein